MLWHYSSTTQTFLFRFTINVLLFCLFVCLFVLWLRIAIRMSSVSLFTICCVYIICFCLLLFWFCVTMILRGHFLIKPALERKKSEQKKRQLEQTERWYSEETEGGSSEENVEKVEGKYLERAEVIQKDIERRWRWKDWEEIHRRPTRWREICQKR
jgi:predicted membrane protein